VNEQAPLAVRETPLSGSNPAASADHRALGLDRSGLRCNRTDERHLELDRRGAETLLQRRLDGQPHASVEHRGGETAMDGSGRIEKSAVWFRDDDDASLRRLRHVIAQGPRHRVEWKRSVRKTLHELQAAHFLLLVGADRPVGLDCDPARHPLLRSLSTDVRAGAAADHPIPEDTSRSVTVRAGGPPRRIRSAPIPARAAASPFDLAAFLLIGVRHGTVASRTAAPCVIDITYRP